MTLAEYDLQLHARRVRAHFPVALQDIAEELALQIARCAGTNAKLLRPQTSLEEIFTWLGSLDAVEAAMGWEDQFGEELADGGIAQSRATFGELVRRTAARRRDTR